MDGRGRSSTYFATFSNAEMDWRHSLYKLVEHSSWSISTWQIRAGLKRVLGLMSDRRGGNYG